MKHSVTSKLPNTGETIFTVMSALASECKAINLGQGSPDFEMNESLIDLVCKAMKDGYNQYTHRNGLLSLREEIAEKVCLLYNAKVDPKTEITITPGGTYAIYTALTSVLKKGDEVIVLEPTYDSYVPNIEINGAIPVLISLDFPDYKINWKLIREKITPYEDISNASEFDFAKKLTKEAGVASIPVSAFYQNGKDNKVLRFCFAKKESTLHEAVERLIRYEYKKDT